MAIVLEANYAKKLGLPNFSSHQYSVTIRTELNDLTQVQAESERLYRLLQEAVDREIQEVGFLPDATSYGMNPPAESQSSSSGGRSEETSAARDNGTGSEWNCSDKQRRLILSLIEQHHLDKHDVERLALEMFGSGVRALNRLEASGLIDELLERHGGKRGHPHRQGHGRFRPDGRGAGR